MSAEKPQSLELKEVYPKPKGADGSALQAFFEANAKGATALAPVEAEKNGESLYDVLAKTIPDDATATDAAKTERDADYMRREVMHWVVAVGGDPILRKGDIVQFTGDSLLILRAADDAADNEGLRMPLFDVKDSDKMRAFTDKYKKNTGEIMIKGPKDYQNKVRDTLHSLADTALVRAADKGADLFAIAKATSGLRFKNKAAFDAYREEKWSELAVNNADGAFIKFIQDKPADTLGKGKDGKNAEKFEALKAAALDILNSDDVPEYKKSATQNWLLGQYMVWSGANAVEEDSPGAPGLPDDPRAGRERVDIEDGSHEEPRRDPTPPIGGEGPGGEDAPLDAGEKQDFEKIRDRMKREIEALQVDGAQITVDLRLARDYFLVDKSRNRMSFEPGNILVKVYVPASTATFEFRKVDGGRFENIDVKDFYFQVDPTFLNAEANANPINLARALAGEIAGFALKRPGHSGRLPSGAFINVPERYRDQY